jgi:hypothetical protein
MARLPRLHRVLAIWPDGSRKSRNYLTPEAAAERRAAWEEKGAAVSVDPSYPVIWPSRLDDRFDIPDMVLSRAAWNDLAARLGIKPAAVLGIEVGREHLTVTYDPKPDKPGTQAPRTWVVYIENEES